MSLLGNAALAMWWDIAQEHRNEFEHWHSHEHFPERLSINGFLRASRWASADGSEGFFVMYELAAHEVLASPAYLAHLNAPSPWSTRMMPLHRQMVRTQCRVLASHGSGIAARVLTLRLTPPDDARATLRDEVDRLGRSLSGRPGLVGLHLLEHQPPDIAPTAEQRIRGGDRAADWVLLATGCEQAALSSLAEGELSPQRLMAQGFREAVAAGVYVLRHTAAPKDVAA